jgi:thioredoxin 1
MRRPIIVLLLVAGIAAAAFALGTPGSPSTTAPSATSAAIQEYTAEALAAASDDDRTVLFFHATWCATCKLLADDIRANADDIPDDVRILLVDFDTATELKQRYGVTLQHTLVQVNAEGEPLGSWHLTRTLDELLGELG